MKASENYAMAARFVCEYDMAAGYAIAAASANEPLRCIRDRLVRDALYMFGPGMWAADAATSAVALLLMSEIAKESE